jgi:hypothetical protein
VPGRTTVSASSVVGTSRDSKTNNRRSTLLAQCRSVRRFAPEYIDLVVKNQDLRFTPCPGVQQPNERTTKQSEQLNHRPRAAPVRQVQSFRQGQVKRLLRVQTFYSSASFAGARTVFPMKQPSIPASRRLKACQVPHWQSSTATSTRSKTCPSFGCRRWPAYWRMRDDRYGALTGK